MFFAEMLHVCMAYVWIDAKSLRQCIWMHFRRTFYWWGHHITPHGPVWISDVRFLNESFFWAGSYDVNGRAVHKSNWIEL